MSHIVTAKKKVLYVITKSNDGGAQRYVFDLATRLPKERFEVAVAMGGSGPLKERLDSTGVRTIEIRNFTRDVSLLRDASTFFELLRLYRNERPDVLHLNSAKAVTIGAFAARVARVPRIISTIHGWALNEPRPLWQRILIYAIECCGTFFAHTTIVVAEADARWGAVVIHNGIEESPHLSREEARKTLGLPPNAFVVGSIGELTKNKNFETLVEAVKPTDAMLVLIGDGEEKERLQKSANNRTVLTGYIAEAGQYLSAFDVFVLPSKKEGLPYVLLMAGQASLPVIATRVGGVPEIVKDGVTGTLVTPGSPQKLTNALNTYINDSALRERHGTALKNHVRTSFVLSRMVDQTIAHY